MKQPKITIVTAAYNLIEVGREKSFRECVEIIHNQTYKNIEHIIINNNSTDGTQKLIDEYVEKGWVTCHFQPIQGLWHAMQKGIDVATGDFINFMNSDDKFSGLDSIELIVNEIVKQRADYAFSDALGLCEDNPEQCWTGTSQYYWVGDLKNVPFGQCMCHQSLFVSMDTMREFGGFDFNYKLSLDNHMMLKLQLKGKKPAYVPKPLVTFFFGGWSSQLSGSEIQEDYKLNFYDQIGKSMGLTLEECGELRCFEAVYQKDEKYCRKLAKKITNKEWRKTFLDKLKEQNKKDSKGFCHFFGAPVITFFQNEHKVSIKCLQLPIFDIERKNDCRTARIFGEVLKIIKTEKKLSWYILGVKVFSKNRKQF